MLYLLDANTLIHAKDFYYPFDIVPEFWDWLVHQGESDNIKIPIEIYEEFKEAKPKDGEKDALTLWAEEERVKKALLFDEEALPDLVSRVTYGGYTPNPTDDQLVKIGRDPFLISYALKDINNRCIVTTEVSKPSRKEHNRHVPDVCNTFGIRCIDTFKLVRELSFSTSWNR